jgi:MoxR-like ATPase
MTVRPLGQTNVPIAERLAAVLTQLDRIVVGKREPLRLAFACLLARGHLLIEDIPGVGKSTLAQALATTLGLKYARVQFTSDLLPADVLGVSIFDTETRAFRFHPGPIFHSVVLADEINRAPPRTQAALLEAMQEHSVTASGQTMSLPEPFFVLATQNPIEQEGTYPLPEAQLDRFLFDIRVGYPSEQDEIAILRNTTGSQAGALEAVLGASELLALQRLTRDVVAADSILKYAASLVRATRPDDPHAPELVKQYVRWGAGPRAGQSLILGAKANALLSGRLVVSPADVKRVAMPVLRHRVLPNFAAEAEGIGVERIIDDLLSRIEPPRSDIRI